MNEKFQDLLFKPENLILQGNDQLFYRNARDRVPSIELELNNIELLMIEIKEELFDTTYIINNDLITFLFLKEDKRFTSKFNRIKKQFINNLDGIIKIYSIELIQKLDSNILIKLLIENKQLVEFIEKCSDEKKSDLIFSLMTKTNFETENKVLLNKLVNDYLDFSKIALDNDNKNVMDNIKRNNIKFSEINQDVELTKEIYSKGLFIINENNINFYIKKYRNDKTYNNILKDIIDDKLSISSILKNNFEYFIKNVWIKFPEVLEDNETIISLPNLKGVNKELFKDIIVKNGVKLYDINKLENSYLSIVLENKMLENRLTDLLYLINENNYSDYINDLTNVVIDTDNEVSIDEVILLVNNVKIDIRELEGIPINKGEFDFTKVTNEKYLLVMFENIEEENYGELMEYSFKNKMIEVQKKLFSSRPGYFNSSNISFILDELYELIFNENNSSNIESFIKDTPEIIMDNFDTNKNIFLPLIYDLAKEQKINKELVFKSYNVEQSNDLLVNQLKFDNLTKEDIINLFKESQDYKKDITDVRTRFAIDLKDLELLNQLVINNIISLRKLRNNVEEDYYINYT